MEPENNRRLYAILLDVAKKVSMGDYDNVDSLMELTNPEKYPAPVSELAEAFGMMIVRVESREYNLEQLLEELREKNVRLEASLKRVRLLEGVQSHLSKFVPRSVQDIIKDNPENPDLNKRERDLSVLFLDIAGYTRMSENNSRERMNYLIETYFSEFLNIIVEHRGDINETAGDGLMILFQDDDPRVHTVNAVSAALGIQQRTARINESLRREYDPVTVNMGINSGKAFVGSTRFKGVAGERWTYTASGPVTNIAARVCSASTKGRILATADTCQYLEDRFPLGEPWSPALKNVSRPVTVQEVKTGA